MVRCGFAREWQFYRCVLQGSSRTPTPTAHQPKQDVGRGERIATPVCALVRNDSVGDGEDSPGNGNIIGACCKGRRGRRPLRRSAVCQTPSVSLSGCQLLRRGRRANLTECKCIRLHTKYKYNYNPSSNPDTAQTRSRSRLRNILKRTNTSILTASQKAARGC